MPEYPNLARQHADYIEHSLKAYRAGQRKNPVMGGMAAALTDKDISELAAYYSSQRPALCATNETGKMGKCAGL
jgi:cytochrome c553